MPDITMCKNEECPLHMGCYRFRATPSCYQSYSMFSPDMEGECQYYWPTFSEQARLKKRSRKTKRVSIQQEFGTSG